MKTVVVDKIAPSRRPAAWATTCASTTDNIPPRKAWWWSSRSSPASPLQHARAHQRPHGEGQQGRHRRRRAGPSSALFGYSGHVPEVVKAGDVIQMLNIGGVLGVCDSANPDKGKPFDCRVLGVVLQFPYLGERIGVPARAGYRKLDYERSSTRTACPSSRWPAPAWKPARPRPRARSSPHAPPWPRRRRVQGHRRLAAARHPRDGGCRRAQFDDLHRPRRHHDDAQERPGADAHDADELAAKKPDVIVFELGDGILGTYGVDAILECDDIRKALTAVVLSANDPVAAWGGVKLLRERFTSSPAWSPARRPTTRRRRHHRGADERQGVQRDDQWRSARRLRHRGHRPRPEVPGGGRLNA
jgi:hypothetical protein